MTRCFLVLQDGSAFGGISFGAPARKADELHQRNDGGRGRGEVVFNTAMCGYHEMLTDPSYSGQMVVLTYPHAGNYGCNDLWSERGPDDPVMPEIKLGGLLVRSLYSGPVPGGRVTLDDFLKNNSVPGLSNIDTRSLTLHLRNRGSCNGLIVAPSQGDSLSEEDLQAAMRCLGEIPSMEGQNLLSTVGTRVEISFNPSQRPRFVVVDCGVKGGILRELASRGVGATVLPWSAPLDDILSSSPDGVLFSNGPGDPATLPSVIETIRNLLSTIPVFGICLGHQMIAHALGGRTRKMKFGHHGCNHPVREERTGRVQVTSQNHGFEVDGESLPPEVRIWFRNANDGSVEGLMHDSLPVMSCQFHPEAAPGPRDSSWVFDEFLRTAAMYAEKKEVISCRLGAI